MYEYKLVRLNDGEVYYTGDYLVGAHKPTDEHVKDIITMMTLQKRTLGEVKSKINGHFVYWVVRPMQVTENEFGQVSP
jgi:hypothetical protein